MPSRIITDNPTTRGHTLSHPFCSWYLAFPKAVTSCTGLNCIRHISLYHFSQLPVSIITCKLAPGIYYLLFLGSFQRKRHLII